MLDPTAITENGSESSNSESRCPISRFSRKVRNALSNFQAIQKQTLCPFAKKARLIGAPTWNKALTLEQNLEIIIPSLDAFIESSRRKALDGYVIEIEDKSYGNTIEALSKTTRKILTLIKKFDPNYPDLDIKKIEDPEWQFNYRGQNLFVITISPAYGPNSSRYGYGSSSTFILLQPEHSFDSVLGSKANKSKLRKFIREKFAKMGQGYDLEIMNQNLEAPRFVKPLYSGAPIIQWWKY